MRASIILIRKCLMEKFFLQLLRILHFFLNKSCIRASELVLDQAAELFSNISGVNVPDHDVLLHKLVLQLQTVTPYIATVWSRDAGNLKNLIEEIAYQLINAARDVSILSI